MCSEYVRVSQIYFLNVSKVFWMIVVDVFVLFLLVQHLTDKLADDFDLFIILGAFDEKWPKYTATLFLTTFLFSLT